MFGFEITRAKAPTLTEPRATTPYSGWCGVIREPYTGAWQHNVAVDLQGVQTYSTVFACATLIASDIAKCRLRLVEQDTNGIWNEVERAAFSPVLRKPNRYQIRIKFVEQWLLSKLLYGNAYVLKERDQRGIVISLYVLDPCRVRPLIAPDGSVYYQLGQNYLAGILEATATVPASEIIHDPMYTPWHPLIGVSPICACGLAAMQGLKIQGNSAAFFANGSNPGGVLTAPGAINDETAARLKAYWDANYTGANVGKVAVLGDGLKYEAMTVNAVDAQLIEQLKWTSETVCSVYHVPAYMVGVGPPPNYNNIEALNQQYYSQTLQELFESFELSLDEGLGLAPLKIGGVQLGTEFDIDDLLRMDSKTLVSTIKDGINAGALKPNEGRAKLNLPPVVGGDSPYLQQQNYSLAALNKRDTGDPFPSPAAQPASPPPDDGGDGAGDDGAPEDEQTTRAKFEAALFRKMRGIGHAA